MQTEQDLAGRRPIQQQQGQVHSGFRSMAAAMSWSQLTKMLDAARVSDQNDYSRRRSEEEQGDQNYGQRNTQHHRPHSRQQQQQQQTYSAIQQQQQQQQHTGFPPMALNVVVGSDSNRSHARTEVEYLLQRHFRANGFSSAESTCAVVAGEEARSSPTASVSTIEETPGGSGGGGGGGGSESLAATATSSTGGGCGRGRKRNSNEVSSMV